MDYAILVRPDQKGFALSQGTGDAFPALRPLIEYDGWVETEEGRREIFDELKNTQRIFDDGLWKGLESPIVSLRNFFGSSWERMGERSKISTRSFTTLSVDPVNFFIHESRIYPSLIIATS